ncbi:MAG TPA: S1C family serine protease [Lachnospiraceae bacterium]|nr:S1C family serine protease [Lachnospiraceae bacterium]
MKNISDNTDSFNQNSEKEQQGAVQSSSDYEFIQEKIKDRPINKRKLMRKMIITAGMAVVFGLFACLTFMCLEPVFGKLLSSDEDMEELQLVTLPEAENEEIPLDPVLVETPIEEMNLDDSQSLSQNLGAGSPSANYSTAAEDDFILELTDYQLLYRKLYAMSQEVSKSIVTVTGITSDVDWMNETYLSTNQTTGLILANNGYELLILADEKNLANADSIRVTFVNGVSAEAELKRLDSNTNLAVYAVRLAAIDTTTRELITTATIGSSYASSVLGNAVIAIGCPLGTSSVCYGAVTSADRRISLADASYQLLSTDIYGSQTANGVIINTKGQVVGIICQEYNGEGMENLIYAYGISSIRSMIERMSNDIASPYLGLCLSDVSETTRTELGIPQGVYVDQVELNSPAMSEGIAKGDVIQSINGIDIYSIEDYMTTMSQCSPGDTVTVTYSRLSGTEYKVISVEAELGTLE